MSAPAEIEVSDSDDDEAPALVKIEVSDSDDDEAPKKKPKSTEMAIPAAEEVQTVPQKASPAARSVPVTAIPLAKEVQPVPQKASPAARSVPVKAIPKAKEASNLAKEKASPAAKEVQPVPQKASPAARNVPVTAIPQAKEVPKLAKEQARPAAKEVPKPVQEKASPADKEVLEPQEEASQWRINGKRADGSVPTPEKELAILTPSWPSHLRPQFSEPDFIFEVWGRKARQFNDDILCESWTNCELLSRTFEDENAAECCGLNGSCLLRVAMDDRFWEVLQDAKVKILRSYQQFGGRSKDEYKLNQYTCDTTNE